MKKEVKVQGNSESVWIGIPKMFREVLELEKGQKVNIELKGKKLIVTKEGLK